MQAPNYYDKIYLVCYPAGSGGNFLINCLNLSDQGVFRDAVLARRQIEGSFGYQDKLDFLKNKLQQARSNKFWTDLDLGCSNLFGVDNSAYVNEFHEILAKRFDPVVDLAIQHQKNLFLVVHQLPHLYYFLQFWPNAQVIFLTNYRNFVDERQPRSSVGTKLREYWDKTRDSTWPEIPPTNLESFQLLDDAIKHDLVDSFHFEIQRWFDYTSRQDELYDQFIRNFTNIHHNRCLTWDVSNNYRDSQSFCAAFEEFSARLEVSLVPAQDLIWYFNEWLSTIKYLTHVKLAHAQK